MLLIVGLGNPGKKYQETYHNCGFAVLDALAEKLDIQIKKNEAHALTAHISAPTGKVVLAKPQTFMNLSGKSVWALAEKYKISKEELVVVFDDTDLSLGAIRMRENGGTGTHNGMRDIVARVGTNEFKRMRIGIGAPQNQAMQLADFVLSRIDGDAKIILDETYCRAADALEELLNGSDFQSVMQKFNQCP